MDVNHPTGTQSQAEALALRYGDGAEPAPGPWNEVIATLLSHRSVRGFLSDPLPEGTLETLVAAGHAYYCYCSADRLRQERERAETRGEAWQYDRACLNLPAERIAELEASGAPRAVRFKVPPGVTAFDDVVHGRIEFDEANIEDDRLGRPVQCQIAGHRNALGSRDDLGR